MTQAAILPLSAPPVAAAPARDGAGSRIDPGAPLFRRWIERIRCRRELSDLALFQPDSVLLDVGVSRREALREAAKPFWRA